jgi:glycosyltransferase involved in cell wall biosynthesis
MAVKVLVSVVIPCFNQGRFLADAIQSVAAQTYPDIEVIIVDDGSTESHTKTVLDEYQRTGMSIIRIDNSGPSAARNVGIVAASGKYIMPLDADDRLAESYIDKAVAAMEADDDVGIVYCQAEFFGLHKGAWALPAYDFPAILLDNAIFSSMLYRKEDWQRCGKYNENMREGLEDYDFVVSLAALGKRVVQLPETLFYYRVTNASRNRSMATDKAVRLHARIYRNHEKLYSENIEALFASHYASHDFRQQHDLFVRQSDKTMVAKNKQIAALTAENQNLRLYKEAIRNSVFGLPIRLYSWIRSLTARAATKTETGRETTGAGLNATAQHTAGSIQVLSPGVGEDFAGQLVSSLQSVNADYVLFLPSGTELKDNAIGQLEALLAGTRADLVYWDELMSASHGAEMASNLKPDFSMELLLGQNFIGHTWLARRELLEMAGGVRPQFNSAALYELLIRAAEQADLIYHCRETLSRVDHGTGKTGTGDHEQDTLAALTDTLYRHGIAGEVLPLGNSGAFRIKRQIAGEPLVSIIIPIVSAAETFTGLLKNTIARAGYSKCQWILVHAGSLPQSLKGLVATLTTEGYRVDVVDTPDCGSRQACIHAALTHARGEHLVFLGHALEIVSHDWIPGMLEHSQQANVAGVGIKILNKGNQIMSAGYAIGHNGPVPVHQDYPKDSPGYNNRLLANQNITVPGSECMMIKSRHMQRFAGFDTKNFASNLADADLCLRMLEEGYLNVFTPFVEAIDHSAPDNRLQRFSDKELQYFRIRHRLIISLGDYYYNEKILQAMCSLA